MKTSDMELLGEIKEENLRHEPAYPPKVDLTLRSQIKKRIAKGEKIEFRQSIRKNFNYQKKRMEIIRVTRVFAKAKYYKKAV